MTTRALVVGAGPAGLSAAGELARWCDTVTVVEARPRCHRHRAGEHVPPTGLSEMARLGLADVLLDGRHDPSPGVRSVWGAESWADKEYFGSPAGRGLNLQRALFDEALARRAVERGTRLRYQTRLESVRREGSAFVASVSGSDGREELDADVLLDASGRRSDAARHLCASPRRYDRLVGVVGRIEGCQASEELGRVRVESAEDGWWYGVQFSDGCLLAAWMTDAINLRGRPGGAHGLWREQLRSATLLAPIAESGRWPDRVAVFDAATQILDARPIPGFLAVGDAAAAYDPLSSWGITKGVRDGCAGAEALRRERSGDRDAVAQHRAVQRRDFDAHRTRQRGFYRAETRWATSPFWRIRQRAATSTRL